MNAWVGPDAVRVCRDVQHLHDLGPRAVLEFLTELAGDEVSRADIEINLARYARLTPAMITVTGACELMVPVTVVVEDTMVNTEEAA